MEHKNIWIYWIDRYVSGYRAGVSHGSKDGLKTLCGMNMKPLKWDGGYSTAEYEEIECKKCLKNLENPT